MNNNSPVPLNRFLPYMPDVTRCEQSLNGLNLMWQIIEASAKMNCPDEAKLILPTIQTTRASFARIQQDLVSGLVNEKIKTVLEDIGTKAKHVIDIVVRNLFERTADIGFLSTDNVLCAYAAGLTNDIEQIQARLCAYRDKYTVYDEIILLDLQGKVLTHIDAAQSIEYSRDPLLENSLQSPGYIETFRASDLRPNKKAALIYSQRLLHPTTKAVVGVLCLCFDFEHEMATIFNAYRDEQACFNMMLLNMNNQVIACADTGWVSLGATMPVYQSDAAPAQLRLFGGREYLIKTVAAEGYQGYMGPPGWKGQVMIPTDIAFRSDNNLALAELEKSVLDGLVAQAAAFSPPLRALYEIMQSVNRNQRCVVWNGQLMTAAKTEGLIKLKTVLEQINETAEQSNILFEDSIGSLCKTVLTSRIVDAEVLSHLLVDILDRNLYERADDCRWWALMPELRMTLGKPRIEAGDIKLIMNILDYINKLYTVYTRIYVYDAQGEIIASTHAEQDEITVIGTHIDADTLASVRSLKNSQQYYVSAFASSPLYGDQSTYIYHAAIFANDDSGKVLGGIGIVFDAAVEFPAMLRSALATKKDAKAFFVDRDSNIIASSDSNRVVGSCLTLEPAMLALNNGSTRSKLVINEGQYTIMSFSVSSGYREFKVSDGYSEDVIAVVFDAFASTVDPHAELNRQYSIIESSINHLDGQEFATFFIDGNIFALPASCVLEAVSATNIKPMSMGGLTARVGVVELTKNGQDKQFVWVYDFNYITSGALTKIGNRHHVIIMSFGSQTVGILVGDLHAVPEFSPEQITDSPLAAEDSSMLVTKIIHANEGRLLLQLIDVNRLFDYFAKLGKSSQTMATLTV